VAKRASVGLIFDPAIGIAETPRKIFRIAKWSIVAFEKSCEGSISLNQNRLTDCRRD
jgi:hypothetical protein